VLNASTSHSITVRGSGIRPGDRTHRFVVSTDGRGRPRHGPPLFPDQGGAFEVIVEEHFEQLAGDARPALQADEADRRSSPSSPG
jgi:hypothetical protein